jgi:hypothetical protein
MYTQPIFIALFQMFIDDDSRKRLENIVKGIILGGKKN